MSVIGFVVILGIVLVVFYLFTRKIFNENKIVDKNTADNGKVLPIDIDKKLKKQQNTYDKKEKDDIDYVEDKKNIKKKEIDDKKLESVPKNNEKNDGV